MKPESEFLDLGYKIGIVMTLIVYLIANILLALFCIVSWTVATNAMINIRHGRQTLLGNAHMRPRRADESESEYGDEVELVR